MSRVNQPKNKRLDNLEVVTAKDVWENCGKDPKTGKQKYRIKAGINIFGRVSKGTSAYVSKGNRKGENHKFVDDFSSLNKNTKVAICNMFENENKKVAYLVEKNVQTKKTK